MRSSIPIWAMFGILPSMRVLVAVKRVIDYRVRVRVNAAQTDVEKNNVKMSINPFDEIALEAALRFKERGIVSDICVVSIGSPESQEVLRHGLAMGADRAILVESAVECEPLHVAKILQKLAIRDQIELVLLGKQAIDNDSNQTGQMLAGLLHCSQGTFASEIKYENDCFIVTREIDGGLETVRLTKPAVITSDLRLNTPRFISMPNIMKARSKPLEIVSLESFNLKLKPHLKTLKVESPPVKKSGIKVANFLELMTRLKEAGLL